MPIQSLQVPQSQFNAELQNITNQTNDLIALGVPQNLAQSYGDNASVAAMNPNSIYYTGGLSAANPNQNTSGSSNLVNNVTGAALMAMNGQYGMALSSSLTATKLSSLKDWTLARAAVVLIGLVMIIAGIMMLSTKETINIAPTVAKTVAENPEMVA